MSRRLAFSSLVAAASSLSLSRCTAFCMDRKKLEDEPRQPSFRSTDNLRRAVQDREVPVTLDQLVLISGNGHKELALNISHLLKVPLAKAQLSRFSDGEVAISIDESIRGKNVFILQSCVAPVNDNIMELLLTVSCVRREGANRVIAVIPYFGYKHHRRGSSLSTRHHSRFLTSGATDFAKMLQTMGVDRVIAVDLQRAGQGHEACFFDNSVPLETVISSDYQMDYFIKNIKFENPIVVVAPNAESVKRARNFQLGLQQSFGDDQVKMATFIIEQGQDFTNLNATAQRHKLLGNPKFLRGSDVIIVDDMLDTAVTLSQLSNHLIDAGARNIYLCASHGLFTEKSMDIIDGIEPLKKVIVTDSLPLPKYVSSKVHQVTIAPMLAEVIRAEHFRSVKLFEIAEEERYIADDE